jgi:hypothetical protein
MTTSYDDYPYSDFVGLESLIRIHRRQVNKFIEWSLSDWKWFWPEVCIGDHAVAHNNS